MIGAGLALALLLAAGGDTVVLTTGERVEGRVVEASPSDGVKVQLPDGRLRWIHPMSVERIDRADGTSRTLREPARKTAEEPAPEPVERPVAEPEPAPTPAEPEAWREAPPPAPAGPAPAPAGEAFPPRGPVWLSFAVGHALPFGRSGGSAPMLEALVGNGQTMISLEGGIRLDGRDSLGAVFDFTSSNLGDELRPLCDRYGRECDAATAQLGVFLRRDFDPGAVLNRWASIGIGREWLAGEVFEPNVGSDSVTILSAPGWQLPRIGLGVDWRTGNRIGLGLYATAALGIYDRVTLDGVDVNDGKAVHGWAQLGLRAILGP